MGEDNGTVSEEDAKTYGITESEVKEAGIPEFWKKALMNSKFFEINDKGEEVLNHLKNVTLKLADDSLDFTVTFHFATNEFFEHATLYKSYVYDKQTFEPISANSSVITWNEGKNPSKKMKLKKSRRENLLKLKKLKQVFQVSLICSSLKNQMPMENQIFLLKQNLSKTNYY